MKTLGKTLSVLGAASALALTGVVAPTVAPQTVASGTLQSAQATHASGPVSVWYTWHYYYRCQWIVQFAGEPFYKGYMYKAWYRVKHVDYSNFDTYWHGFNDYKVTYPVAYREYPRQVRCAGGEW